MYTLVQNGNVRKLPFAKRENSHSAAKGRWRFLLIVSLGNSSQMTKVLREWGRNCAKNLNYSMSWVSVSESSLFWDVSCCREIKGVNNGCVSHYLEFLSLVKGQRWRDKPSCSSLPLRPHECLPLSMKKSCSVSGLLENKTYWWPLKIPASLSFLFGTLCPKSFMRTVNPIITQLTLKDGSAAQDHWTTLHAVLSNVF